MNKTLAVLLLSITGIAQADYYENANLMRAAEAQEQAIREQTQAINEQTRAMQKEAALSRQSAESGAFLNRYAQQQAQVSKYEYLGYSMVLMESGETETCEVKPVQNQEGTAWVRKITAGKMRIIAALFCPSDK